LALSDTVIESMPLAASERELAECSGVVVALALPALDANATRADAALASQWDNFFIFSPFASLNINNKGIGQQ